MLNAHPADGETPSFKGSMLICIVDTEEEAWEIIRNDIYVKSDVWDLDAAQVIPVRFGILPPKARYLLTEPGYSSRLLFALGLRFIIYIGWPL
jgi:hypothetical protein